MGIADRDYMKERRLQRRGRLRSLDEFPSRPRLRRLPASKKASTFNIVLAALMVAAAGAVFLFATEKRRAETGPEQPFPATGRTVATFSEANSVEPRNAAPFQIIAADSNAVVQLLDPTTNEHQLSVFVRANEATSTTVPAGTYRLRIGSGPVWYGDAKGFGRHGSYQNALQILSFTARMGHTIQLERRVDGNLPTVPIRNEFH